jgi:hypothetical protein
VRIELFAFLLEISLAVTREIAGVSVFGKEGTILIRTGDDAIAATHAFVLVYLYDTIRPFGGRLGRADLHTGGLFALITTDRYGG